MQPPKTDSRFLFYTPKNMFSKRKGAFIFNAYKVNKYHKCLILNGIICNLVLNRLSKWWFQ